MRKHISLMIAMSLAVSLLIGAAQGQDKKPKNVILMISDGAGFNQYQAGAYYQYGDLKKMPYADFPVHVASTHFALAKPLADGEAAPELGYDPSTTWDKFNNLQKASGGAVTTDSAAAGTALNTGVKTTNGRIGMDDDASADLKTVAEIAAEQGKATGAVTSVQFAHATPAAVDAHDASRNHYAAIARNMILDSDLDVIMGAGHPDASPEKDAEKKYQYVGGKELWTDLTDGDGVNGFVCIQERADFEKLASGESLPPKVVGVAKAAKTLNETAESDPDARPEDVPSLATMSKGALNVLGQEPKGFYLMIEGGAIDWAGHANDIGALVREQSDFNDAVAAVIDWVETNSSWDETLLIITADHETGQLWGEGSYDDADGDNRFDPKKETFADFKPIQNRGQGEIPGHMFGLGNHTNTLVPVWAKGLGSQRLEKAADKVDARAAVKWGFSGKYLDNTDIAKTMIGVLTP